MFLWLIWLSGAAAPVPGFNIAWAHNVNKLVPPSSSQSA